MLRRLYLLFPNIEDACKACDELRALGIDRNHIHTLAHPGVDIGKLPPPTLRQRSDLGAHLENLFWSANLLVFTIAGLVAIAGLVMHNWALAIPAALLCAACYVMGRYFVRHIPRSHISDFKNQMSHGDVLLLADVPRWRVYEIERVLKGRHPEMDTGGVGWTVHALGI